MSARIVQKPRELDLPHVPSYFLCHIVTKALPLPETALPRFFAGIGALLARQTHRRRRLPWLAMVPGDIGLFLQSARTDAEIIRVHKLEGSRAAFEAAYTRSEDPWASASPSYRYQWLKYEKLVGLVSDKQFRNALDLGCGLGLLSQKLTRLADNVLGIDLAPAAIELARRRGAAFSNLTFEPGDVLNLPASMDGKFDLVVVADVLYYLSPLNEDVLHSVVDRIAALLSPGGTCLVANHFFFFADPESRVSRQIHRAFAASPRFAVTSQHRKVFFLATVFAERSLLPT